MAAVIDLTAEESPEPPRLYAAAAGAAAGTSRAGNATPSASTARATRTIELGDDSDDDNDNGNQASDDIVFLRSERLHLPAQPYALGRDGSQGDMFGG